MVWLLGGLVLLLVGALLRRVLYPAAELPPRGLVPLDPARQAIYQLIALEVETRASILGISLNDAFEERDLGHHEIAWRLVQLSVGEWNSLAELVADLLRAVARYAASEGVVVPFRGVGASRFKSATMVNYVRMHELLDQLVLGSNRRFQLHLRVLRRASETLTAEFRWRYGSRDRPRDHSEQLWKNLDLYFHDFDLIAKEVLLAFRDLLLCLPQPALPTIDAEVKAVVGRGVRSTFTTVERPSRLGV
jgi:hypothetical protein